MADKPPIFLITGTPGAGKSSVAVALMRRFPLGLNIPIDDLREWVVSGGASPVPVWTDETTRQFHLARKSAAQIARLYADAGFAVAIDDVIFPAEAQAVYAAPLSTYSVHKILLKPDIEIALARNASRTNKSFDTAGLAGIIRQIHDAMPVSVFTRAGWIVIDSTHLTLDGTVDDILRRI